MNGRCISPVSESISIPPEADSVISCSAALSVRASLDTSAFEEDEADSLDDALSLLDEPPDELLDELLSSFEDVLSEALLLSDEFSGELALELEAALSVSVLPFGEHEESSAAAHITSAKAAAALRSLFAMGIILSF